jgi:hypothetical protein
MALFGDEIGNIMTQCILSIDLNFCYKFEIILFLKEIQRKEDYEFKKI